MIKRFCDYCGAEIKEAETINKIGFGYLDGDIVRTTQTDIEDDMDFCDSCAKRIMDAIRSHTIGSTDSVHEVIVKVKQPVVPTAITAVAEKGEPAEEPKKKTTRVDIAKIWSLKDAGWPVGKIAQELGCSKQTVYNILHDDRPEMHTAYDAKAATCQTR